MQNEHRCKWCLRLAKTKNGNAQHEWQCNNNPKRGFRTSWNKGLTKDIDSRVNKNASAISIALKGRHGHPCSLETREKLSKYRKEYLLNNPDKIPYLLNHSSKRSYPEKYFSECFSDITDNIEEEYRVGLYSLDFANPKEKIYFEVDGEQHYVDERIVAHDNKRTKELSVLGWVGIRIRWSEFKRLSDEEKITKVKQVRSMMKWLS